MVITQSTLLIDIDEFTPPSHGSELFKGAAIYSSFSLATPLLHLIATTLLLPRYYRINFIKGIYTFPFNGGTRTFIFQFLAWSCWLTSLSVALPLLLGSFSPSSSSSISLQYTMGLAGIEILSTIASVGAVFSLLFLLKSILVFEEPSDPLVPSPSPSQPSTPYSSTITKHPPPPIRVVSRASRLPSKPVASVLVVALGLLWATLGSALLFIAAEYNANTDTVFSIERGTPHSNSSGGGKLHYAGIYYALAAAAFATGVFTTHGLAGRLLYEEEKRKFGGEGGPSLSSSPLPLDTVKGSRKKSSSYSTINNNKKKKKGQPMPVKMMLVGWRFFQPFQGGAFFIATQALGWALFSLALLFIIFLSAQAGKGVVLGLRWWSITTTSLAFAAEISLAASLAVYKGQKAIRSHPSLHTSKSILLVRAKRAAIMSALFIPTHIFVAIFITSFLILPTWYALPMWAGGLTVYYICSGTGVEESEHGSRTWPGFQEWLGKEMDSLIPSWMGSFEIISEWGNDVSDSCDGRGGGGGTAVPSSSLEETQDEPPPQNRKYIFGYAPHSLYPIWAGIIPLTQTWRRMFPDITPIPLSASVIFMPPLLRDVASWVGTRSVSRRSFVRALNERRAVIMVPGGQAELLEAYRMKGSSKKNGNGDAATTATTNSKIMVLVRRHKGFARLAVQEQASLVPLLVLGELNSLWNLVEWPWLAKRSYKILGFPVPFLIVGKWNILPLPAKTGLRVCVGKPIHPPLSCSSSSSLLDAGDDGVEKQVDEMHRQYYEALAAMFERHSRDFPGYENVKLVLE